MFNFLKPKVVLILGNTWEREGVFRMRNTPSKGEIFYFERMNRYYEVLNVIHWGETKYLIVKYVPQDKLDIEIFEKYKNQKS